MSPPDRSKGEYRSAQREDISMIQPGSPTMMAGASFNAADVVVPIYNAPTDVRACVTSVLAHLRPDVRLMLIDDASPDPAIAEYFAELEQLAHPQVLLLRNEQNLGFTGTANRGMQLSRANVVLLNSDTIVSRGWLDALMHCAATDPDDRDGHAIFKQRGDLLVSAILRGQPLAGGK